MFQMLAANQSGEMKLSVETDMVAVNTHFKNLFNPSWRKYAKLIKLINMLIFNFILECCNLLIT